MKRLLFLWLVVVSSSCYAASFPKLTEREPVALSFERIGLTKFIALVYGDILHANYVLHPALATSEQLVSVSLDTGMDKAKIRVFMASFLASVGITVLDKGQYLFLVQSTGRDPDEDGREVFFYRPKHRSVSYIVDLTSTLFRFGRFSSQRSGVRAPSSGVVSSTGMGQAQGQGQQTHKPSDNGSSAYSVQDKGEPDALVFQGSLAEVAMLQKLLPQVDTPSGEVLVHGVLYEVTTTSAEGSGLALFGSILKQHVSVKYGATASGGDALTLKVGDFSAVLSALASDTRFRSVNNASVRVKSGASGVLSVGASVPVLGGITVAGNGTTQQSITYQPSGVIFNLSPVIRDGAIDLTINEQISSFVATTTGVSGSPTLIKREMSTTVTSSFEDVIVLGGLDQDATNKGSSGVNFFPAWMRAKNGDVTKTELILLLKVSKI